MTLAPFVNLIWTGSDVDARNPSARLAAGKGVQWYPSIGIGVLSIFDLVRIDVARGLRNGRWTFSADVARDFWRIL